MSIEEDFNNLAKEQGLSTTEKNGVILFEKLITERKSFLNRKKLIYKAWTRIDDAVKTVAFSESLVEKAVLSAGYGFNYKINPSNI